MKFLQTGDWHLGKTFYELPLIEDQKTFLSELTSLIQKEYDSKKPYDALIVPGDIYDRAVPPAEAVTLFSNFLRDIHSSFPDMHLFFLSGNHDSADRLSYAREILSANNIHFCTDCASLATPVIVNDCAVYQLPFLTAGCIAVENENDTLFTTPLRGQQELLTEAVSQIHTSHMKKYAEYASVLCAHLFATGATRSNSERIPIGTAEEVSGESFSSFTYTALGHLHSFQKVGSQNAYYSGSPLAYSFAESNNSKYVLSVEVNAQTKETSIEKRDIHPLHKCTVINDSFDSLYASTKYDIHSNEYIQIICADTIPIANPMALLRKKFPYILSFTYEEQAASTDTESALLNRKKLMESNDSHSLEKLFLSFLTDMYGADYVHSTDIIKKECALLNELGDAVE